MMTSLLCKIFNKKILIEDYTESMVGDLRRYFSIYMDISDNDTIQRIDSVIKIFHYDKICKNYKIMKLAAIDYIDAKYRILMHRDNVIFVNKKKHMIYVFLRKIDKENLEFIENIVNNVITKLLEREGIMFLRASCVCKNGEAIAFIEDKDPDKTSIMCQMLQNGYDIISNNKIGFALINEEVKVFGTPSNIKIKKATIEKCFLEENKKRFIDLFNFKEEIKYSEEISLTIEELMHLFN